MTKAEAGRMGSNRRAIVFQEDWRAGEAKLDNYNIGGGGGAERFRAKIYDIPLYDATPPPKNIAT